jgi:hypothetical protein
MNPGAGSPTLASNGPAGIIAGWWGIAGISSMADTTPLIPQTTKTISITLINVFIIIMIFLLGCYLSVFNYTLSALNHKTTDSRSTDVRENWFS